MQRNLTILGLSRAMILIESGEKGGSMAAGREAIRLNVPLFAPVYDGMPESAIGNRLLLEKGARPLMKSRETQRAQLRSLRALLNSDNHCSMASTEQDPEEEP